MISLTSSIVTKFAHHPEHSVLEISEKEDTSSIQIRTQSIWDRFFSWFKQPSEKTKQSVRKLKKLIGEERLKRICQQKEIRIDPKKIQNNTLLLTKDIVRKIFVGMANPCYQDFKRPSQIDTELKNLIPFTNLDDCFLGKTPKISRIDSVRFPKGSFKTLMERVRVKQLHSEQIKKSLSEENLFLTESEMLSSRLADREIQEGSIVRLKEGYFYVAKVLAKRGAYVSILRNMKEKDSPAKIICRGTASQKSTEGLNSNVNNLLLTMGLRGTKAIWSNLRTYLEQENIQNIEILGKSQGGAHAQQLAVLAEGAGLHVISLTTFASVGGGRETNSVFKKKILSKRTNPFKITIIRNGGNAENQEVDYIPSIGGEHLGAGADTNKVDLNVYYMSPSKRIDLPEQSSRILTLFRKFLFSFKKSHLFQTTLSKFYWKKVETKHLQKELKKGNLLERFRLVIAHILNVLTLTFLNGKSFEHFFKKNSSVYCE